MTHIHILCDMLTHLIPQERNQLPPRKEVGEQHWARRRDIQLALSLIPNLNVNNPVNAIQEMNRLEGRAMFEQHTSGPFANNLSDITTDKTGNMYNTVARDLALQKQPPSAKRAKRQQEDYKKERKRLLTQVIHRLSAMSKDSIVENPEIICYTLMLHAYDRKRVSKHFPNGIARAWGARQILSQIYTKHGLTYTWATETIIQHWEAVCMDSQHTTAADLLARFLRS